MDAKDAGGKILFFGNGGSASDAQHFASEPTIRFTKNRRALAGLALTTDTSALTACSNDFGFDRIFARQIEALARGWRERITVSFRSPRRIPEFGRPSAQSSDLRPFESRER